MGRQDQDRHDNLQPIVQKRLFITGVVQGVGFRPFIYRVAKKHGLTGFVKNTGLGVLAFFEGHEDEILKAVSEIKTNPPPQARIDHVLVEEACGPHFEQFEIVETEQGLMQSVVVPPDIGICEDCKKELLDPNDPRYLHPFISCTNCGPRLTIIRRLPYDRATITQGDFPLCPRCESEYRDPSNRRYHAQTIACPDCGPKVFMGDKVGGEAIEQTKELIKKGEVVAIRGIGGFHLACLARNEQAVQKIRKIKQRGNEPLAVMVFDVGQAKELAELSQCEVELLASWRKPIVIAKKAPSYNLAQAVAPGTDKIGIFLPYTPLHILLMKGLPPVVMTSANLHEEPIAKDMEPGPLTPFVLSNDRAISVPLDDSVARCFQGKPQMIRRARGHVPELIGSSYKPKVLALGGQMKNTFTFAFEDKALVSHHIGEMGNAATFERYKNSLVLFREIFGFSEEFCAYDLHPSYTTSLHKEELTLARKFIPVQHHHAHIASVIAENGLQGDVIGVAADGTGFGTDGTIWGFEFFTGGLLGFERVGHLRQFRLPGGEAAIHDAQRTAFSLAHQVGVQGGFSFDKQLASVLSAQLARGINSPITSSLGRLFDAFAFFAGLGKIATFEAELAVLLETAHKGGRALDFPIRECEGHFEVNWEPALIKAIASPESVLEGFHEGIANAIIEGCLRTRGKTSINQVALSGGCFLNLVLSNLVFSGLTKCGFFVYTNFRLPPNDGCVSFGQAVIAQAAIGG